MAPTKRELLESFLNGKITIEELRGSSSPKFITGILKGRHKAVYNAKLTDKLDYNGREMTVKEFHKIPAENHIIVEIVER